jgi:hypothetical protein
LTLVVRRDLHPGSQAAQLVHAAIQFQKEYPHIQDSWYNISNYVALLSCENEQALKDLINKAQEKGIKYSAFNEPDLYNSLTSVTLEPCVESTKLCSSFPLAFKEYSNIFTQTQGKEVINGNA